MRKAAQRRYCRRRRRQNPLSKVIAAALQWTQLGWGKVVSGSCAVPARTFGDLQAVCPALMCNAAAAVMQRQSRYFDVPHGLAATGCRRPVERWHGAGSAAAALGARNRFTAAARRSGGRETEAAQGGACTIESLPLLCSAIAAAVDRSCCTFSCFYCLNAG